MSGCATRAWRWRWPRSRWCATAWRMLGVSAPESHVNEQRNKLSSRDYKHGGRGGPTLLQRYQQFLGGLAAGPVRGAGGVSHGKASRRPRRPKSAPQAADEQGRRRGGAGHGRSAGRNTTSTRCCRSSKWWCRRRNATCAPTCRPRRYHSPGVYVLQAGSYRNQPDAERMRSMLAKQGIEATVQRVQVDADVWHRVRIGPIRDLKHAQ